MTYQFNSTNGSELLNAGKFNVYTISHRKGIISTSNECNCRIYMNNVSREKLSRGTNGIKGVEGGNVLLF